MTAIYFPILFIFHIFTTVQLQNRKKTLLTCLNTTKTTTIYMDNDHLAWSVCVAPSFIQHITPRVGNISAFQPCYGNVLCYKEHII